MHGTRLVRRVPECTKGKQVRMGRDFGFSNSEVEHCTPSWPNGCPKLQSSPKGVEPRVVWVVPLRFWAGAWMFDWKGLATVMEGLEVMPKGIRASEMKGPA